MVTKGFSNSRLKSTLDYRSHHSYIQINRHNLRKVRKLDCNPEQYVCECVKKGMVKHIISTSFKSQVIEICER